MYPFNISRMSNECDVLSNVVRGRLTHSSAFTPLCLVGELLANKVSSIIGDDVVVKRVGQLRLPGELNQAREVFLAQKTYDAIDIACVTTCILYNCPTPAQVIKKNY
jgi:hypothetical protein